MLYIVGFRSLDHILAVELLQIISGRRTGSTAKRLHAPANALVTLSRFGAPGDSADSEGPGIPKGDITTTPYLKMKPSVLISMVFRRREPETCMVEQRKDSEKKSLLHLCACVVKINMECRTGYGQKKKETFGNFQLAWPSALDILRYGWASIRTLSAGSSKPSVRTRHEINAPRRNAREHKPRSGKTGVRVNCVRPLIVNAGPKLLLLRGICRERTHRRHKHSREGSGPHKLREP
ncbi:uncharacterized protein BT62DRAFT_915333 [Guyanagaster necrorhizus]|uniref:Uncharacterized protein n=1 Tax=Guyanagaster necrorhizus TaxID=856835 RepID=A0A9P7W3Z7_9AGAR|nr:uncharacterized protein BT62DRAFT_915333 [Guyanagaster necrorhizus MCA 3950]KAG7452986.1 hypothetical protein BT62DRAFT_915333 [Guyanagaster necrorhizus MCA 3950]